MTEKREKEMAFAVLVSDNPVMSWGPSTDEPEHELIGPFDTQDEAFDWAYGEIKYVVEVLPLTMRENH